MDGETYPPNPRLRREREVRNWTLETAARELRTLMASHGETQIGINFNAVSRWERGARRPGKCYRHYLCLLYGKRSDELGFLPPACAEPEEFTFSPAEGLARRDPEPSLSVRDGHTTQLRCTEGELEDLNITRRKLLAASGLLGAALGTETAAQVAEPLDRAARIASGRAAADDVLISDLRASTDALTRSSRSVAGELLAKPISAHAELVTTVLRQSLLPEQRDALLEIASRSALLMTGAEFFDRRDRAAGQRWLNTALELGEATTDPNVHVRGMIRAAEIGIYTGRSHQSVRLLELARRTAERACSPNTMSWILATQAEAYATLQQPRDVVRLLDLSAAAQQRSRPGDETSWTEHWSRCNVAGYYGAVHMRLENSAQARVALNEALGEAAPSETKFRSICLVDLGISYAQEREIERACELAGKALEIAGPMHYGTTLERMRTLRRRLARWKEHRAVRELDDRLRTPGVATT